MSESNENQAAQNRLEALRTAYIYDDDGYLMSAVKVQENPFSAGEWLLPENATLEKPALNPDYFCHWNAEKGAWDYEKIPSEPEDFEGLAISHTKRTPHCEALRNLIQTIVNQDCTTHRIVRGENNEWMVEKIQPKTLEETRQEKLKFLDAAFLSWYERGATVSSSLGFVADSDARAIMDISGLVTSLEAQPLESRASVAFMDANNAPHQLSLEQLKTLQLEVIQNGQEAYAQKWTLRSQIEAAESVDALNAIEIAFTGLDFSNA